MATISISVIVPVYTGASFLRELTQEIERVRERWIASGAPLSIEELIFVDDAAIDNSADVLDDISKNKAWVTVLHLARNFGQHAATIEGVLHSSGDWVVTMDEDLQHPPAAIIQPCERVPTRVATSSTPAPSAPSTKVFCVTFLRAPTND